MLQKNVVKNLTVYTNETIQDGHFHSKDRHGRKLQLDWWVEAYSSETVIVVPFWQVFTYVDYSIGASSNEQNNTVILSDGCDSDT